MANQIKGWSFVEWKSVIINNKEYKLCILCRRFISLRQWLHLNLYYYCFSISCTRMNALSGHVFFSQWLLLVNIHSYTFFDTFSTEKNHRIFIQCTNPLKTLPSSMPLEFIHHNSSLWDTTVIYNNPIHYSLL